jgi:hypothetical protein
VDGRLAKLRRLTMWIVVGFFCCIAVVIAGLLTHRRVRGRQDQLAQDLVLAINAGDVASVEAIMVAYAHELSAAQMIAAETWLKSHPRALPEGSQDWNIR